MENLKNLLEQQKAQIEKDLEQNGHDIYKLKCQEAKLKKMLKGVNAQIEIANEPEKKQ